MKNFRDFVDNKMLNESSSKSAEKDIDKIRAQLFDNSKLLSRIANADFIDAGLKKKIKEAEEMIDDARQMLFDISKSVSRIK